MDKSLTMSKAFPDPIWVLWKKEKIKDKHTKVPYGISGKASSIDNTTWMSYTSAKQLASGTRYDGIGIVFSQDVPMLGIDLDHVLTNGSLTESALVDLISEANTYTEISPSGNGLHLIFRLSTFMPLSANKHKNPDGTVYECYTKDRYFTVTENPFWDVPVRTITPEEAKTYLEYLGYPWRKAEHIHSIQKSPGVHFLEDAEVLKLAFNSKNGAKIKRVYNGDTIDYNNDESSADLALCSHLAFYSGRPDQVEKLWLESPLGNRQKTQERLDYRTRTITQAFSGKTEFYTPKTPKVIMKVPKKKDQDEEVKLIGKETKNGLIVKPILENIIRIMQNDEKIMSAIRYNEWTNRIEWKDKWLEDRDIIKIQSMFQANYPQLSDVAKTTIADAVEVVALQNTYNPIKDWLNNLSWDGTNRLEDWIDNVCGYPEDDSESFFEYRSAVGIATIKAMVARALNPGTKYDHMLVIEGDQGTGKSTLVQILAGNDYLYSTNVKDIRDKDFKINSEGKWIVELSEGSTISMSSVQDVKHMITETISVYRPAYGRLSESRARQFILMMTTNETTYLRDRTGNRRFLPIKVYLDFIDIDWLRNNRTQLFAEAVHLWKQDTSFYIPIQESKHQQELRLEIDPIEELVSNYLDNHSMDHLCKNGVDPKEIWTNENDRDPSVWDMKCINKVLSTRGYTVKQVRVENKRKRLFFPPLNING